MGPWVHPPPLSTAKEKRKRKNLEWRTYIHRPRLSTGLFVPVHSTAAEDRNNSCHLANGTGGDLQGTVQLACGELGGSPRHSKNPSPTHTAASFHSSCSQPRVMLTDLPPTHLPSVGPKTASQQRGAGRESHCGQWQTQWDRVTCRERELLPVGVQSNRSPSHCRETGFGPLSEVLPGFAQARGPPQPSSGNRAQLSTGGANSAGSLWSLDLF